MKDNEQSKYIRWGIPGWVMFITFFGLTAIDILFSPESDKNQIFVSIRDFANNIGTNSSMFAAIAALLVAAAGIPLGFMIYQVYFYVRWNSPFSSDGFFPPFVVGRRQDLKRSLDGIKDEQISENDPWRKKWIANPNFNIDHGVMWRYLENYFIEKVHQLDATSGESNLYARYRYLLEL